MINKREILLGGLGMLLSGRAEAAGEVLRVPLARDAMGYPLVSLHINDQGPFVFRLDAGARHSTIGLRLANRLKLQLIGDALDPYEGTRDGKSFRVYRVNAAKVETGGGPAFKNVTFLRGVDIEGVDGIIGNVLFSSLPCILDDDAGEIRYYDEPSLPLDGFHAIPAKVIRSGIKSMAVVVETQLAGIGMKCGINTSSGAGVFVSSAFVKAHGLWDKYPDFVVEDQSADGKSGPIRRVVQAGDFKIGPFRLNAIQITLCDPANPKAWDDIDAIVGAGVLSLFSIAFDGKGKVWLKPNPYAVGPTT